MKISEMIENLQKFMAENGDLECWYATDDEGNSYQKVHYNPSKYYVDDDGEVHHPEDLDEDFDFDSIRYIKPICIIN